MRTFEITLANGSKHVVTVEEISNKQPLNIPEDATSLDDIEGPFKVSIADEAKEEPVVEDTVEEEANSDDSTEEVSEEVEEDSPESDDFEVVEEESEEAEAKEEEKEED